MISYVLDVLQRSMAFPSRPKKLNLALWILVGLRDLERPGCILHQHQGKKRQLKL